MTCVESSDGRLKCSDTGYPLGMLFRVALFIVPMTPALSVLFKALIFTANTLDRFDQWRKVHKNAAS